MRKGTKKAHPQAKTTPQAEFITNDKMPDDVIGIHLAEPEFVLPPTKTKDVTTDDVIEMPPFEPQLNTIYLVANSEDSFLGEIISFDPLKVDMHFVRGGCTVKEEVSIDSLDEYGISEVDKDEVFRTLSEA